MSVGMYESHQWLGVRRWACLVLRLPLPFQTGQSRFSLNMAEKVTIIWNSNSLQMMSGGICYKIYPWILIADPQMDWPISSSPEGWKVEENSRGRNDCYWLRPAKHSSRLFHAQLARLDQQQSSKTTHSPSFLPPQRHQLVPQAATHQ